VAAGMSVPASFSASESDPSPPQIPPQCYAAAGRQHSALVAGMRSAVEAGDISPVQEVLDGGGLPGTDPAEWQKWWAGERQLSDSYLVPQLGELCKRIPFDMIVLDAAEFYGPAEYKETMAHCLNAKYVALHDAKMWQNKKPKAAMLQDPAWKLISDDRLNYATAKYVSRLAPRPAPPPPATLALSQ
jgi:hypothetical protein